MVAMKRRALVATVAAPHPREYVRDEAIAIPHGETVYTIDLDEATVEALERGICPEDLAQRMHDLLRWRREAIRATAGARRAT